MSDAAFERAVDLFNDGRYHDALDAFEEPYHARPREEGSLLLAMIRSSAAMYHFSGGRYRSARKLYASARTILEQHAPHAEGIDVAAFLSELNEVFAPLADVSDGEASALRPARNPSLTRVAEA